MIELRGGFVTTDPRLDRLPTWDQRSNNWPIRELLTQEQLQKPRSYTWDVNRRLNQGNEGRCVEFGICHELIGKPKPVGITKVQDIVDNRRIYWPAQERDEWEGGSYPGATPYYEGTSVHAGMAVAKDIGYYGEYRWAFTIEDFITAVGYHGPGVIGIDWYENMFNPDARGVAHVSGAVAGGHCVCINHVDVKRELFGGPNSWGEDWGAKDPHGLGGYFFITFADMEILLKSAGEFCIPGGRKT